jgi:hypothetical protein
MSRAPWDSRFDAAGDVDPLQSLGNLLDVMLVFACGLIAALVASRGLELREPDGSAGRSAERRELTRGRELSHVPRGAGSEGSGYEAVGQVYRDEKTGKLILIGDGRAMDAH